MTCTAAAAPPRGGRKSFERENPSCFLFQGWPRATTYQKQQHQQQPGHTVSEDDDDDNGFDKGPERHPFLNSGANNYRLICIMLAKLYTRNPPTTDDYGEREQDQPSGIIDSKLGKGPLPSWRKSQEWEAKNGFIMNFLCNFQSPMPMHRKDWTVVGVCWKNRAHFMQIFIHHVEGQESIRGICTRRWAVFFASCQNCLNLTIWRVLLLLS